MSEPHLKTALAEATFGNGCFWCTEAVFLSLNGVSEVVSGYAGGSTVNPTYREVCSGTTGHAEVIRLKYDPAVISFETVLAAFFASHDPTTLNRQGNDIGTQYRSVIFYHDAEQKRIAEGVIQALTESGHYRDPIVTEVSPLTNFYPAEDYHQDYFAHHGTEPYCQLVVGPKVEKFRKAFAQFLKPNRS